jgi:hypothetical protein
MTGTTRSLAFVLVLTAIAAGLVFTISPARAQQAGTAGIYGSVVDAQGGAIPGAKITLTHIERNQERVASANAVGQFVFPLIPIGTYKIRVE